MAVREPPLLRTLRDDVRGARLEVREEFLSKIFTEAAKLYHGHVHWTGISLIEHVLGVLKVLLFFKPDQETITACILHHVLDQQVLTLDELEEGFGPKVRSLVSGIHLLSHVTLRGSRSSIEDLRLMILSVSDDVRVILMILCDRCHVLESLEDVPPDERRSMAQDALSLFAPVAARLGIYALKQRLERAAFPILYSSDAERIEEQLERARRLYGKFLPESARLLQDALGKEGIFCAVDFREKSPYSIFQKMREKALSDVSALHDLFALRVMVKTTEECYRALGMVHKLAHPVPNRFKDMIAFPKPNGYQSLHTTVTRLPGAPEGVFIEVQVRTENMHREAELGIAAHWSYKQGGRAERLAQWTQLHRVLSGQQTFAAEGSHSSYIDHIFVLTPRGQIVELPEGATPLDFAFQIHTDLGLTFKAAKVNGTIASLDHALENGDTVEIIRQKTPNPSPEWMALLKMASSRSRLKRYLYSLERESLVDRGRELVNAELMKRRVPPLDGELSILKYYDGRNLSREEREDQLLKIGQGSEKAVAVLPHLDRLKDINFSLPKTLLRKERKQRKDSLIEVEGGLSLPLRFAKCCKPQEKMDKPIVGLITRKGDVSVHLQKCRMVKNSNPSRRVVVKWRQ